MLCGTTLVRDPVKEQRFVDTSAENCERFLAKPVRAPGARLRRISDFSAPPPLRISHFVALMFISLKFFPQTELRALDQMLFSYIVSYIDWRISRGMHAMTDNKQNSNGGGAHGEGVATACAEAALSMIVATAVCPLDGRHPSCGMPCGSCTRVRWPAARREDIKCLSY